MHLIVTIAKLRTLSHVTTQSVIAPCEPADGGCCTNINRVTRIFRVARDSTPKPHADGPIAVRIDARSLYTDNSAVKNQIVNMHVNNYLNNPNFYDFQAF